MKTRRITLIFREDAYELVSEDNSGASVSRSTGLVSIEPGDDSLPPWCLSPEHVVGFESTEDPELPGRSVFLAFETEAAERHRLYLGTTSDTGAAEGWVARVNSLYPRSESLDRPGNAVLANLAPSSGTPFLDELIDAGRVTWAPGIYGNMVPRPGDYRPPGPYNPVWLRDYAGRVLQRARDVTGGSRQLQLVKSAPPGIDTDALIYTLDLVRPYSLRENKRNPSRAVLSGELLFEEGFRRPDLKILAVSEVTHLALLVRHTGLFYKSLNKREFRITAAEREVDLAEWLKLILQRRKKERKIPVVTHEKEVSDFHLMDTLSKLESDGNAFVRFPAGGMESIAELLHRFEDDDAILVCDVGTANELSMYYAFRYRGVRGNFEQLWPRYTQPVRAGLGLAAEDPLWCEICAQALRETVSQNSTSIQNSLKETKKRVERLLGMRWLAAA